MPVDHLLKPSDLVRFLGTSRSWVYEAAKRGEIPSIRLGGQEGPLRFVERDIEAWIDDARERWRPGLPAVATRPRPASRPSRTERSVKSQAPMWTQLQLDR
jgi:predicted DNA-binding transcriptional regulator AlpA